MGTRSLIAVQLDDKYKVAQYSQWDGYPRIQGRRVLSFITLLMADTAALETFKDNLRQSRWVTSEELEERWVAAGAEPGAGSVPMGVAEKFTALHPALSRDTGAYVLPLVLSATPPLLLCDMTSFAQDSLFCEWAYVIDLDTNTFEVYTGFNKEPATGRFAGPVDKNGYGPVVLAQSWPLDQLPDEAAFFAAFDTSEDE